MRLRAALLMVLAIGGSALSAASASARSSRPAPRAHLAAFDSCADLVDFARNGLSRTGGGVGVPVRALGAPAVSLAPSPAATDVAPVAGAPASPTASLKSESAGDTSFSGTNNQEADVDESDVVKTDGKRMFTLAGSKLLAIDVTGAEPKLLGSLELEGSPRELLLRGDRLLVLGAGASPNPGPVPLAADGIASTKLAYPYYRPDAQLIEVDVHDAAAMKIARTLTVPGSYLTARLTGGTARVVLDSPAELPVETTTTPPGVQTAAPVAARSAAAKRPGLRAFVPRTVIRSRISGHTFTRPLVDCRQVRRPDRFSGLDLLTVMTIDFDHGLYSVDRDAVLAGAQVVYASAKSLYVASQRYLPAIEDGRDVPGSTVTEIHRFDASQADRTSYVSSGTVPGFLLNQYSLSEQAGVLRVASTEEPPWRPDAATQQSTSTVTTLRESGSRLEQLGSLGGLGAGERIFAVRFIDDVAYVVTFKQVDPLHVIDLSDPANPRKAGELEITGYSAYLHPIGPGLLLGVGQDATAQGRRAGAQVSVFDVSDPAHPSRLHHRALGADGSSTQAEFDPHAFLWWGTADTAVLPLQDYSKPSAPFTGAIGLRVRKAQGIEEIGRIQHGTPADGAVIQRAIVVGDRLFALSPLGVSASRLDTLAQLGFLAFPQAPQQPLPVEPQTKGVAIP